MSNCSSVRKTKAPNTNRKIKMVLKIKAEKRKGEKTEEQIDEMR